MKSSDQIKQFLDFIKDCQGQYLLAVEAVGVEDKRTQDLLHAIEFEPHAKERGKLATKLKNCRSVRRENKDIVEELEPIVYFANDEKNMKTFNQLTQLLGQVRKVEKYHESRSYHPRVEVDK